MYNYKEHVKEDTKKAIEEYIDFHGIDINEKDTDELTETLFDKLWIADSVTGNGSGSYTFNAAKAEENLAGNWSLAKEAMDEFGCTENPFDKGPEWVDVTIRCYLLSECISEVLNEMKK